jgi:hypothetical protein
MPSTRPPAMPLFGTCPRCHSPEPPAVTRVAPMLLYFTCATCSFEWSVVPSYVGRLLRFEET